MPARTHLLSGSSTGILVLALKKAALQLCLQGSGGAAMLPSAHACRSEVPTTYNNCQACTQVPNGRLTYERCIDAPEESPSGALTCKRSCCASDAAYRGVNSHAQTHCVQGICDLSHHLAAYLLEGQDTMAAVESRAFTLLCNPRAARALGTQPEAEGFYSLICIQPRAENMLEPALSGCRLSWALRRWW